MNFFASHSPNSACSPLAPCARCKVRNYLIEKLKASVADVKNIGDLLDESTADVLLKSIEDLELSVRTAHCLRNANLLTLGAIVEKSEAEFLRIENFGRKSLNELKEVLAKYGLTLRSAAPG